MELARSRRSHVPAYTWRERAFVLGEMRSIMWQERSRRCGWTSRTERAARWEAVSMDYRRVSAWMTFPFHDAGCEFRADLGTDSGPTWALIPA
jgi:hypothetical protein